MATATVQLDIFGAINAATPTPRASVETPQGLDLYCAGGGAGEGYQRAGFQMTGVDRQPVGRFYRGRFIQGDALDYLADHGHEYDFVHASPPCQGYSWATPTAVKAEYDTAAIVEVKALCDEMGLPCIIENVREARHELDTMLAPTCDCFDPLECEHPMVYRRGWREPIRLCGEMFGLGVLRHRYFEVGGIAVPRPAHVPHRGSVGDGTYVTVAGHGGDNPVGGSSIKRWQDAMGIDWITDRHLLAEAIPPAYTHYLGSHTLAWL